MGDLHWLPVFSLLSSIAALIGALVAQVKRLNALEDRLDGCEERARFTRDFQDLVSEIQRIHGEEIGRLKRIARIRYEDGDEWKRGYGVDDG